MRLFAGAPSAELRVAFAVTFTSAVSDTVVIGVVDDDVVDAAAVVLVVVVVDAVSDLCPLRGLLPVGGVPVPACVVSSTADGA